ncbi:hypothetical protein [Streptomyces formicae]|uniref:Uncharacterized protein n=1 Tax=Streptomyces formicae TaxID=1616117 RepID=A0ABY3WJN8_9ACTN|nr:hypothetical protein [Streptomyces formicae]UNM12355.1 hypothetical protein J4032_13120 [Streptomyces formicae]
MSVSSQKRRAWEQKIHRLTRAAQKANEDVLVAIYEATEDGLTQADVAYMVGGVSPSGIKPKAIKGAKILKERKGS